MSIALRVSALLCIVIGVVLWAGPALLRVDLFDDDAAQHVYWLYRYMDPALFPGDASVQYFRTSAPLGYRAFYSLVAAHFDALAAAEWLSVGLFLVTTWFAWGFATSIPGPARELRGLAAVVAVIGFIVATHTSGGIMWVMAFQRTLALPLILGCMWALQNGRYLWVGVTWLVAGLVYPVVLPVLGIAAGAVFLRELVLQRHMPRWWLANVLLAALAIAAALYGLPHADNLLPDYTYEQAKTMPEFGTSGRLALYTTSTLTNIFRYHMTGLGWPPLPLAALAIAALLARFSPQRRLVSFEAWIVLFAGVGLWGAMRVFPDELMFGLYVPNRHARWAIAAFGVAAVPAGVCALLGLLVREVERGRDRFASWAGYAAIVAAPLLVAALLLPDARAQWHAPVDQDLENTYAYLATLPKDVIIGAASGPRELHPAAREAQRPQLVRGFHAVEGGLLRHHEAAHRSAAARCVRTGHAHRGSRDGAVRRERVRDLSHGVAAHELLRALRRHAAGAAGTRAAARASL